MSVPFTRTLRLKVRPESHAWLNAAAVEVNGVFNYCNQISFASMLSIGSAPCNDEGICGKPSGCIDGSGGVGRMPATNSAVGW